MLRKIFMGKSKIVKCKELNGAAKIGSDHTHITHYIILALVFKYYKYFLLTLADT